MNIYLDAKRRGIYPPVFTSPSGDSCILSSQGAQIHFIVIVILSLDSSRLYSNLDWLSFVTDLCSCFLLSVLPEQMVSEKGQVGLPFV